MSATILISTGARLHFGFFAHDGARSFSGETNYGGVGLMIDAPTFGQPVQIQPVMWNVYVGAVRIVG